jgi:EmrB/QacA subfamily drug resistance transporter
MSQPVPPHPGKTHRPLVLAAIMMAMFMAAIEGTIVATSMPGIAAALGGMSHYSWVFSSFLLMQAVTVPVYGKLSDLFGRKRVFIAGIVIFLTGSVLCGFAWSMPSLVAFRFLQGFGAGAVQPLALTLIGDLYAVEERGRTQGYIGSVWGVSSIVGPLAGALIVQHLQWSWIFWINVPFGLICIVLVSRFLHENIVPKRPSIDYRGAGLLFLSLSALMLALTRAADWGALALAGLIGLAIACGALFLRQERRAPDPLVHLELWRTRLIALSNAATLTGGMTMMGLISLLPIFVQGVLGGSALVAGFALCAMSIGWPIASVVAGRMLVRLGSRRLARFGGIALLAGTLVVALSAGSGPMAAGLGSLIVGVGLGVLNTTFIVSIQASVPWAMRGAATASNLLMRIMGSALGAAVFGGILNLTLNHYLAERGFEGSLSMESVQSLLGAAPGLAAVPLAVVLQAALSSSLHWVFWGVVVSGAVTLWIASRLPDADFDAASRTGAR